MSDTGGSIKNPENEAENPAPMPNASKQPHPPTKVEVPRNLPISPVSRAGHMVAERANALLSFLTLESSISPMSMPTATNFVGKFSAVR
jgi:hypothetical protein